MLSEYNKGVNIPDSVENDYSYLKAIFEAQQNGIFVVDKETHVVVDTNIYAVDKTGYTKQSVVGNPVSEFIVFPENAGCLIDKNNELECKIRTIDGDNLPVFMTSSSITRNGLNYQILSFVDITQLEEKLHNQQKYTQELEKSIEYKDLFTDIIRHDLLNPAGLVNGFTQVLLDIENDSNKIKILKKIKHHNEKLINVIESASKLSRLELTERLELNNIDISPIISNVVDDLKDQIDEKGIKVETRTHGSYPALVNDIIEDVFYNLLSNAIKYSPENSRVTIAIQDEKDFWKINFADSGEGVDKKDKSRLFERFERADKSDIKGLGLGLAIVKRVIELHGGKVGVYDNPEGIGNIFWVTLKKP
ncbi:PAS/PAC sensor signal transduction histidine kinase [Methanohalobium evestigatum Z-7303]|uniref:histidine kinase n=1 Tax=Methanohalobium evestigatum (strain ATCC BAA-1072 / DSM 3721 / NBRC 107634 / OCM 161 / Z-7303) TaxID=644295 RepID=D7EAR8_METEZ|nr:PAS domain-containing sensor histidine kinase [Methanohalobium evestigatum]ADI74435.1 PAS/PAC sensor signal transduction histidine kinase [Methanohalobium evestigatum Z-7303]